MSGSPGVEVQAGYDVPPNIRAAVTALCVEYCWRVDNGRTETVPELFRDNGVWRRPGLVYAGREALLAGWQQRAKDATHLHRVHINGNHRLQLNPDGTLRGWLTFTAYVFDRGDKGEPIPQGVGEYDDVYEQDGEGRWLFRERSLRAHFPVNWFDIPA